MPNELILKTDDMPMIIKGEINKTDFFNIIQQTKPISELVGKRFSITGIIPEMVKVPFGQDKENSPLIDRMRIILLTNIGPFHSFSVTLNSSLVKLVNMFDSEFMDFTYELNRSVGAPPSYYILKIV